MRGHGGPRGSVDALFTAMATFLDEFPLLMRQLSAIIGETLDPASPSSDEAAALLAQIVPLVTGVANAWPMGENMLLATAELPGE